MNVNEKGLMQLVESVDGDQELYEGIKEIFQKFKLKRFLAKFLQKGNETVYFAFSKNTNTFAKAVFVDGQLQDTTRYQSMGEMESDISLLKEDGYKEVNENKASRFVKLFVRNLGRFVFAGGAANFIASTILAIGAGVGVAGVVAALPAFIVTGTAGWMMVSAAEKKDAIGRDHGGLARTLGEGEDPSEQIRQLVRDQIRKQAEKALGKDNKEEE